MRLNSVVLVAACLSGCMHFVPVMNSANLEHVDFVRDGTLLRGEACSSYVFGVLGPYKSHSIQDAAQNGGITKIKMVESSFSYFILFSQICTIVYGKNENPPGSSMSSPQRQDPDPRQRVRED